MPQAFADSTSVAANSVSANVLEGTALQYIQGTRLHNLLIAANGSATGLRATLIVGEQSVLDDVPISDANRYPNADQDFLFNAGAQPGDRVVLRFRNTTAGALTAQWLVKDTVI